MSTPFRLALPRQLLEAMIAQARAELPNECCGLLAGTIDKGVATVTTRYPLRNELASPVEYSGDPRDLLAAHKDMRQRGIDWLGVYHSHPTSPPIPSRTDRARAYTPDVVNFIISLASEPADVRAWWLTPTNFDEASWDIVE